MSDFQTKIIKLAEHIVDFAQQTGASAPPFQEKIDALKTATGLYAILTKYKQKQDDEGETSTFGDFAAKIEEADGRTKVRSRRGTGLSS